MPTPVRNDGSDHFRSLVTDCLQRYHIALDLNNSLNDAHGKCAKAVFILTQLDDPRETRTVIAERTRQGFDWQVVAPFYAEHKASVYIDAVRCVVDDPFADVTLEDIDVNSCPVLLDAMDVLTTETCPNCGEWLFYRDAPDGRRWYCPVNGLIRLGDD